MSRNSNKGAQKHSIYDIGWSMQENNQLFAFIHTFLDTKKQPHLLTFHQNIIFYNIIMHIFDSYSMKKRQRILDLFESSMHTFAHAADTSFIGIYVSCGLFSLCNFRTPASTEKHFFFYWKYIVRNDVIPIHHNKKWVEFWRENGRKTWENLISYPTECYKSRGDSLIINMSYKMHPFSHTHSSILRLPRGRFEDGREVISGCYWSFTPRIGPPIWHENINSDMKIKLNWKKGESYGKRLFRVCVMMPTGYFHISKIRNRFL